MSSRNSKLSVQNWTPDPLLTAFCSPSIRVFCWSHSKNFFPGCSVTFLITLLPYSLESIWHPGDTLMSIQAWSLWHKGPEEQSSSLPVQDTQHQHPTVPCSDASRNARPILRHASCPAPTMGFALDALISTDLEAIPWLAPIQARVVSCTVHWIPFLLGTLWPFILFQHLYTIQ